MAYYTLDTKAQILATADWKFDESALETDRTIVYGRDGKLYFEGTEPPMTAEELAAENNAKIKARLSEIDIESIRPQRAIQAGTGTQEDTNKLISLESEASTLRAKIV